MSIEHYEENLRVYYESIRKDLDIVLTSVIPTQKNLIKTILWINASILGIVFTLLKTDLLIFLSMPFIFSFLGIFITLLALKDGRAKAFGNPPMSAIEDIKDNKYEKTNGLIVMIRTAKYAFEFNEQLIQKRADKIAKATNFTVMSVACIFFIMLVYANMTITKGADVSKETNDPIDTRPKMSGATLKPEKKLITNNRPPNENLIIGKSIKLPQSTPKTEGSNQSKPKK